MAAWGAQRRVGVGLVDEGLSETRGIVVGGIIVVVAMRLVRSMHGRGGLGVLANGPTSGQVVEKCFRTTLNEKYRPS